MSEKKGVGHFGGHQMPSAPPSTSTQSDIFQPRGPPPTYEESQRISNSFRPPPTYNASVTAGYGYPPPSTSSGYQQHLVTRSVQYGQSPLGVFAFNQHISSNASKTSNPKVVEFDAGARFKGKGAGSITIPPPPPGYHPTPSQMAALQGQPVILKKKKNSFF